LVRTRPGMRCDDLLPVIAVTLCSMCKVFTRLSGKGVMRYDVNAN